MRSKTSLFNGPVFRSNMSRYWPVWCAFLIIYLLGFPPMLLDRLSSVIKYSAENNSSDIFGVAKTLLNSTSDPGAVLNAFFAVVAAMAVYSFMYNTRLTGMIASLPLKRESVFFTCWLSGLIWLIMAPVAAAAAMFIGEAVLHCITAEYILRWLLICVLELIFFYGLASVCAVLTGTLYILPIVYGIFNLLAVVLEEIIREVLNTFVYGLMAGSTVLSSFLSPVVYMFTTPASFLHFDDQFRVYAIQYNTLTPLFIFAAAGIILSLLALLIYRKRRMESATDIVAIKVLKPVFRWCMAFGCALTLGLLIYYAAFYNFTSDNVLLLIISMIAGGFIGYFGAEMLMRKSFRVFDKWRGFIVFSAIVIVLMAGLDLDIFGYERFVPDTEKVERVFITTNTETFESCNAEKIAEITDIHHALINDRGSPENGEYTPYITLDYKLKNGHTVLRQYNSCGSAAAEKLLAFWNAKDVLLERSTFSKPLEKKDLYDTWCDYYCDGDGYSFGLSANEALTLYYDCILPDLNDCSLGLLQLSPNNPAGDFSATGNLEKYGGKEDSYYSVIFQTFRGGSGDEDDISYQSFTVNKSAERSFAYLDLLRFRSERGIDSAG